MSYEAQRSRAFNSFALRSGLVIDAELRRKWETAYDNIKILDEDDAWSEVYDVFTAFASCFWHYPQSTPLGKPPKVDGTPRKICPQGYKWSPSKRNCQDRGTPKNPAQWRKANYPRTPANILDGDSAMFGGHQKKLARMLFLLVNSLVETERWLDRVETSVFDAARRRGFDV